MRAYLAKKRSLDSSKRRKEDHGSEIAKTLAPDAYDWDVIREACKGPFAFEDLVAIVFCTNGTVCSLSPSTSRDMFSALCRGNGAVVSVDRIVEASNNASAIREEGGDDSSSNNAGRGDAAAQIINAAVAHSNDLTLRRLFSGDASEVKLLLSRELGREASSGSVDAALWARFTDQLRLARLIVFKATALEQGQCFFGKGIAINRRWQCFPQGWPHDVAHFVRNRAHPMLSMCLASKFSAVTPFENALILFTVYSWAILLTGLQFTVLYEFDQKRLRRGVDDVEASADRTWTTTWASIVIVVIPTLLLQRFVIQTLVNASFLGQNQARNRCFHQFRNRMKRSLLVAFTCFSIGILITGSFLAAAWVAKGAIYQGLSILDYIFLNLFYNLALALGQPIAVQYNPSETLFRACRFLVDVKAYLRREAHSLVGHRVMIYSSAGNRTSQQSWMAETFARCWVPCQKSLSCCWPSYFDAEALAGMGTGVVVRVDEATSLCVVQLDMPRIISASASERAEGRNRGQGDVDAGAAAAVVEDELSCVLIRPIDLASLDWIGRQVRVTVSSDVNVAVMSGEEASAGAGSAGNVIVSLGTIGNVISFDKVTWRYSVELLVPTNVANGGLGTSSMVKIVHPVEPQFLKLIDGDDEEGQVVQDNPLNAIFSIDDADQASSSRHKASRIAALHASREINDGGESGRVAMVDLSSSNRSVVPAAATLLKPVAPGLGATVVSSATTVSSIAAQRAEEVARRAQAASAATARAGDKAARIAARR